MMKAFVHSLVLIIVYGLAVTHSNPMNSNPTSSAIKPLNVLFVSILLPGHANALLAFGEELLRHRHNVTFCSTDSSIKLNDKVKERGMKYLSAGSLTMKSTLEKSLKTLPNGKIYKAIMLMKEYIEMNVSPFVDYFINKDLTQWDIIVLEQFLFNSIPCISQYNNLSIISVVNRPFRYQDLPPCPYPSLMSDSFLDKLKIIPLSIFSSIIKSVVLYKTPITDQLCNEVFHYTYNNL